MPDEMNVKEELQNVQEMYSKREQNQYVSFLGVGDYGAGKTFSVRTMPKPILIHSFDPGGTDAIDWLIDDPEEPVFAETQFETSDPENPKAYRKWDNRFQDLYGSGFFEGIETFVLDSLTNFGEAVMREQLKKAGRVGQPPRQRDYQIQMLTLQDAVSMMVDVPCHFFMTAHIDLRKDEVSGKMETAPMVTGKLKTKLPSLFNEIWVYTTSQNSSGTQYTVKLAPDGYYKARSRLASNATLPNNITDQEEFTREVEDGRVIDYQAILKKAGKSWQDKAFAE